MASPIEEKFVIDNLSKKTVYEFGCAPGKFTSRIASMGFDVTGVDLYDAEVTDGYTFIKGDVVMSTNRNTYDNVICVSSIEHSGIESADFLQGDDSDIMYINTVAAKLLEFVGDGSKLIVTAPMGDGTTYYVDKLGNNGTREQIKHPAWGYRTFSIESLLGLFDGFYVDKCKAYAKIDGDYFDINSWEEIPNDSHGTYDNKNRAVLCCVFNKKNK